MEPIEVGGPVQVGRYRLRGRLGAGGMGVVYLGAAADGTPVAVKVVHPGLAHDARFRTRFRREVELSRRVSGPWVAEVVDADPDAELPWLATRFVPGPALDAAIDAAGPLGVDAVRALGSGLARGLAALHAAGVVHRDLKPSNVLLDDEHPRLIDFGISRAIDDTRMTSTGVVIGTPAFMSPEQIAGEEAGPASDVFSLGSVLYYAATGRGPFGEVTPVVLMLRISRDEPDLSALPERLRAPIAACLAKRPRDRPTAADLARLLVPLPTTKTVEGPPAAAASTDPVGRRRRRTWLIGAATAALAGTLAFTLPAVIPESIPTEPPGSAAASPPAEVRLTGTRPVWDEALAWGQYVFDASGEHVYIAYPSPRCEVPRTAVGGTCIDRLPTSGNVRTDQIILEGYSMLYNSDLPAGVRTRSATALALAADGRRLFLATAQGSGSPLQVAVIDVATRAVTGTIPVGGDPADVSKPITVPVAIASAADGARAALARNDVVTLVDVGTATARSLTTTSGTVQSIAFTPDGERVLIAGALGLAIIDADTGRELTTAPEGTSITGVAVMPDGSRALVACRRDGTIRSVDLVTGAVTTLAQTGDSGHLGDVAISSDGTKAFVAGSALWMIDTADGSTAGIHLTGKAEYSILTDLALSTTSTSGVVQGSDGLQFFSWT